MTALLEGLIQLGLSTPLGRGKKYIGEKQSCRKELCESTPSQVNIKNNEDIGRVLRSTTKKKNSEMIKELKLLELGEVKKKDGENIDDAACSSKLTDESFKNISHEKSSDDIFSDKITIKRNIFNINQRRTKSKFKRKMSSLKQEMSTDLYFNQDDNEIFTHKPIPQDDISVNLNSEIETRDSKTEVMTCDIKSIPSASGCEKEKSTDLTINDSQTSPFFKDVKNSFSSKVVSSQHDVSMHINSQEHAMICHVNENRYTELNDTQHPNVKRNLTLQEKLCSPGREATDMKRSFSLIPGKKWRRSFVLQKKPEMKRSTIEPALVVKLVRDASSFCFMSNKSCNTTATSITQAKEADKDLSYKTDNISFDFSNNSILNNTFELLRRVSIRTKKTRQTDKFEKRKSKKQNFFSNYSYNLDEIPEEENSCQINSINTSETECFDTSGVKVLSKIVSPRRAQISEEIFNIEGDQTCNSSAASKHCIEDPPVELDSTESRLQSPKINEVDQADVSLFEKSVQPSFNNSQYDHSQRLEVTKSSTESSAICSTPDSVSEKSCNQLCNDTCIDNDDDRPDIVEPLTSPLTKQRKMFREASICETPPFLKINPNAMNSITKRKRTVMRPKTICHMLELFEDDECNEMQCNEEQDTPIEELPDGDICHSSTLFDDDCNEIQPNVEQISCTEELPDKDKFHSPTLFDDDCSDMLCTEEQFTRTEELPDKEKCHSPTLFYDEKEISQLIKNMDEHEYRQICEMGVLLQCTLQRPLPFEEAFPDSILANCKKIGEGVYGEVFMIQHEEGRKSVIKVIPVEGTQLVNNEPQKLFSEVLSELIITEELSLLRENSQYCTIGFCELKNKHCLQGEYPAMLIDLWHKYDQEKGSDNDCPDIFKFDQRYVALELEHAGEPVESYTFLSAKQAYSAFLQTAFSLGIAEACLEFEHRDLHIGNVLIKRTTEDYIKYIQNGYVFKVPTYGIQATIIDFTLSRISYKNDVLYFDMAKDPELFTAEGDYQFEIYRIMRNHLSDNWKGHEPVTNIRWLHYLLEKFVTKGKYRNKKTKSHTQYLKILKHIKEIILNFLSTYDLTIYFLQSYEDTLSIILTE